MLNLGFLPLPWDLHLMGKQQISPFSALHWAELIAVQHNMPVTFGIVDPLSAPCEGEDMICVRSVGKHGAAPSLLRNHRRCS